MRHLQGPRAGFGVAIFSALAFSTSGALAKSLIDAGWSPAAAVTVRISVAALVLAVPGWMSMRGRWRILRRQGGMVAAYGLIAVAGAQLFYFNAIQTLPVGVALMLEYLGIVLVVAWMWIRHGHRPRRLTLCGSAAGTDGDRISSMRTRAMPATISAPPPSWTGVGSWPSSSQAISTAKITSARPTNDASLAPSMRAAAMPARYEITAATSDRPATGISQLTR